jgi:hypothetical protein
MVPKVSRFETRAIPQSRELEWSPPSAHLWHTAGPMFGLMNTLQLQWAMLTFAGWVNRGQQDVVEYWQEAKRVSVSSWVADACSSLMCNAAASRPRPGQSTDLPVGEAIIVAWRRPYRVQATPRWDAEVLPPERAIAGHG